MKMKNLLIYIFQIALIYMVLTLINMGTVLLLFLNDGIGPVWLSVALTILIIGVTSFLLGFASGRLFGFRARTSNLVALGLVALVLFGSIYLNMNLEPLWYKLLYICTLPMAYFSGYRRHLAQQ